jgi:hypothetical protein
MADREAGVGVIITYNTEQQGTSTAGQPSPSISGRLDRFDVLSETWTEHTDMQHPRTGHAQFTINQSLFVFGGTNGAQILTSVEEYDIPSDTWTSKTAMSIGRTFFQSCEANGLIYIMGGLTADAFGNTSISSDLSSYNPETDQWTVLAPTPNGYTVVMGIAQSNNGNIYLMSGYKDNFSNFLDAVLIYNISTNTWRVVTLNALELTFYERLLPFSFIENNYIYVVDGLYYDQPQSTTDPETNIVTKYPPIVSYFPDAYRYNLSTNLVDRGERDFIDMPRPRYSGATVTIADDQYFIGGINALSNTLRFFEKVSGPNSPFVYDDYGRLPRGRSNMGASSYVGEYGDFIFLTGGTLSINDPNFLSIDIAAYPSTVELDGLQTCQVIVTVTDENLESPDEVVIQLAATSGAEDRFLFTSDTIVVKNGTGYATLIPRAADVPDSYSITINGSVIDNEFYGDTNTVASSITGGGPTSPTITAGSTSTQSKVSLPSDYGNPIIYSTVIAASQLTPGYNLNVSNIGGFLSLQSSATQTGTSAGVNYKNNQPWLPQVVPVIEDNAGTLDDMASALDRLSRERPWGGTTVYDAIYEAGQTMILDATGVKKMVYILTDGEDNQSHFAATDAITEMNTIYGPQLSPVVASLFRIIPDDLYLTQGVRVRALDMENLCTETGGSALYVTSDQGIEQSVQQIINAKGFIGSGTFTFQIDLGDEVLIESLSALFSLPDDETNGEWQYSVGLEDGSWSLLTEFFDADAQILPVNTFGRYLRVIISFSVDINLDEYNAQKLIPPKFFEFQLVYHKSKESYIFFTPKTTNSYVHQVVLTLDCTRPPGSEVVLGVTDTPSATWEDYDSSASPAVENSSRVVFSIRMPINGQTYSLEPLIPFDGYVFQAAYGKWSNGSTVQVYENGETLVDSSTYQVIADKGLIVFSTYTDASYLVGITGKKGISVAAKIINRIHGDPVIISGAGYMYSYVEEQGYSASGQTFVPDVQNIFVTPLQPNIDSTLRVSYQYNDLLGRKEIAPSSDPASLTYNICTQIFWYVNNVLQVDLQNFTEWNNSDYNIAVKGDEVYVVVQPSAQTSSGSASQGLFGAKTRSLPVTIS